MPEPINLAARREPTTVALVGLTVEELCAVADALAHYEKVFLRAVANPRKSDRERAGAAGMLKIVAGARAKADALVQEVA